ncbi:MAG: hypothetical protein GX483_00870 [Actinomycetaceae bacterium]|nr:hypothetical protein [Actinomycetaceae bacterium]
MVAIILIGGSGTGKSAIVSELEERGFLSADIDVTTARVLDRTVSQLYLDTPTDQRRRTQTAVITELLDDIRNFPKQNYAIALPSDGLGTSLNDEYARVVRQSLQKLRTERGVVVIWLQAELTTLVNRNGLVGPRMTNLVLPRKELRLHLEQRAPVYAEFADHIVDTTDTEAAQAANQILGLVD